MFFLALIINYHCVSIMMFWAPHPCTRIQLRIRPRLWIWIPLNPDFFSRLVFNSRIAAKISLFLFSSALFKTGLSRLKVCLGTKRCRWPALTWLWLVFDPEHQKLNTIMWNDYSIHELNAKEALHKWTETALQQNVIPEAPPRAPMPSPFISHFDAVKATLS